MRMIGLIFLMLADLAASDMSEVEALKRDIQVKVSCCQTNYLFGGPVNIELMVTNQGTNSDSVMTDLMPYLPDCGMSFEIIKPIVPNSGKTDVEDDPNGCHAIKTIPSQEKQTFIINLNRNLSFPQPGNYTVRWKLKTGMSYYRPITWTIGTPPPKLFGDHATISLEGDIQITLRKAKNDELKKHLDSFLPGLSDPDSRKQMEAVQSLIYSANADEYIGSIAKIVSWPCFDQSRMAKLYADESKKALVNALDGEDFMAVKAALNSLGDRGIVIPEEKLKTLLRHRGPFLRYAAVKYAEKIGNRDWLRLLEPLLKDDHQGVTKAVGEAIELLKKCP